MLLSLLLGQVAADPLADRAWQVAQVRAWLTSAREAAPRGATELRPGSGPYQEVVRLVSRGCALSNKPAPAVPAGHLWQVDLDGDGTPERVFSGGCGPAPYVVALRQTSSGWASWFSGPGLLLGAQRRGGQVVFATAQDGYGIERERVLRLTAVDASGTARQAIEFQVVGEQPRSSAPAVGEACLLRTAAALRSEPRVVDTPEESGMGFDYPGNLLQALAPGSSGLALGRRRGYRLCAFAAPPVPEGDEDEPQRIPRAMRTPVLLTLTPEPTTLVVGWVPESALGSGGGARSGP